MSMKVATLFFGACILLAGVFSLTKASAYDPLQQACSGSGSSSVACRTKPSNQNPLTGKDGIITRVANLVAVFGGVAAVIILTINGIRYATSNGDSQTTSEAKKGIIAALIGLVVIAVARILVSLVAKGVS